jgi:uncharacterized protein (TIGR02588 family)
VAGNKSRKGKASRHRPPLLEWIAAAVGALIALTMFGLLAAEALSPAKYQAPVLRIEPLEIVAAGNSFIAEIKVRNLSAHTAGAVEIEGRIEGQEETSHVTLAYVPGGSERRAALVFAQDPRGGHLSLRVIGFEHP